MPPLSSADGTVTVVVARTPVVGVCMAADSPVERIGHEVVRGHGELADLVLVVVDQVQGQHVDHVLGQVGQLGGPGSTATFS